MEGPIPQTEQAGPEGKAVFQHYRVWICSIQEDELGIVESYHFSLYWWTPDQDDARNRRAWFDRFTEEIRKVHEARGKKPNWRFETRTIRPWEHDCALTGEIDRCAGCEAEDVVRVPLF